MKTRETGFSVRVAVVVVREGRILLARHTKAGESYWVLPGGRLRRGESVMDCARREVREETGLDIRVGPILYIGEYFGRDFQVLDLFALGESGSFQAELGYDPEDIGLERVLTEVKWHTFEQLSRVRLLPGNVHHALLSDWSGGFKRCGLYIGSYTEEV